MPARPLLPVAPRQAYCYNVQQGSPTVVDVFGDAIISATLCHNTWRTTHSDIIWPIIARAREARLEVEPGVFGLFRNIIAAEAMGEGGELETVRGRSGCGLLCHWLPARADYHPWRGRPPCCC